MRASRRVRQRFVRVLVTFTVAGFAACGGSSPSAPQSPPGTQPPPSTPPPPPAAGLQGVSVTPTSVEGGSPATGSVVLTSAAGAGGATVAVSADSPAAVNTSSVTVASGASSATFGITTTSVTATTTAEIRAAYNGQTVQTTLTIMAAAAPPPPPPPPPVTVEARFSVTPTGGKTGDPCPVARDEATSDNVLQCTFNAQSSTPNPGITEYRWQFPGVTATVTGVQVTNQHVPCGSFAAFSARDVTLTVVAPQGTDTTTQSVTFEKTKAC
jgi:hypothetical protein